MLKILHFVHDEKFIDLVMDAFDYVGGECEHTYILVNDNPDYDLRFIKKKERVLILPEFQLLNFIHQSGCQVVLLHSLSVFSCNLIPEIDKSIKVYWSAWGHDLYKAPIEEYAFIKRNLYWPRTKKIIRHNNINSLRHIHGLLWFYFHQSLYDRILQRIDYFSGVIPLEYELMKNHKHFRAKRLDFRYFGMKNLYTKEGFNNTLLLGDNILIGNSGNYTNNHIDVFYMLKNFDLKLRKIVVPLSYCGDSWYLDRVKNVGNVLFKDSFLPLDTFLPYQQYNQIVTSCGYAIFLIESQQAMGNIHMSLWNGLKVFLSESSILYTHFMSLGMLVFSVQRDMNEVELNKRLSREEVLHNRKILLENLYVDKSISIYRNAINVLTKDSNS